VAISGSARSRAPLGFARHSEKAAVAIYLNNPVAAMPRLRSVGSIQLAGHAPAEAASAHAHSASALRFIMEGNGAYTIVDGHKMTLQANDFVLTPNGTWHEHGVDESGTPCIWQDGLDIPLVNALEANFYAVHPKAQQAVAYPVDDTSDTWGSPGLRPAQDNWCKGYSPLLRYEWEPTYEALQRYGRAADGSPYDGVLMKYVNPITGGHVMQTIGAAMQMLRPGEKTKAHWHTGSFIYQVAKGRGCSIVAGQRFDWQERHLLCSVLGVARARQRVIAGRCLPVLLQRSPGDRGAGLYREEAYGDNAGYQQ
jgi:gentisate 1,2-dioxygenase